MNFLLQYYRIQRVSLESDTAQTLTEAESCQTADLIWVAKTDWCLSLDGVDGSKVVVVDVWSGPVLTGGSLVDELNGKTGRWFQNRSVYEP